MHQTLLALALAILLVASSAYVQPAGRPMARFQAERPNYGGQDIAHNYIHTLKKKFFKQWTRKIS